MKNSNGEKAALDYLERDSVLNADIINTLRSNMGKMLYCGDDGVLVYNTPGEVFLMNASCAECAERMLPLIAGAYALVAHNEELIPMLMERLGFTGTGEGVFIIEAAMPVMTQSVVVSSSCGADEQYVAQGMSISTLACFVSIPLIMMVISTL